jgi:hypothetical protein
MALYDADLSLGIMRMWTTHTLRVTFHRLVQRWEDAVFPPGGEPPAAAPLAGTPPAPHLWWGDSAWPSPHASPALLADSNTPPIDDAGDDSPASSSTADWGQWNGSPGWESDEEGEDAADSVSAILQAGWDHMPSPSPAGGALCCGQKAGTAYKSRVMRVTLALAAGNSEVTRSKSHARSKLKRSQSCREPCRSRSAELEGPEYGPHMQQRRKWSTPQLLTSDAAAPALVPRMGRKMSAPTGPEGWQSSVESSVAGWSPVEEATVPIAVPVPLMDGAGMPIPTDGKPAALTEMKLPSPTVSGIAVATPMAIAPSTADGEDEDAFDMPVGSCPW